MSPRPTGTMIVKKARKVTDCKRVKALTIKGRRSMRRLLLAALLSLMAIRPLAAQSIEVPSEVKVDMPGLVVVRATKMDADDVRWYPVGSPKLQTFPSDVLAVKPGTFVGIT